MTVLQLFSSTGIIFVYLQKICGESDFDYWQKGGMDVKNILRVLFVGVVCATTAAIVLRLKPEPQQEINPPVSAATPSGEEVFNSEIITQEQECLLIAEGDYLNLYEIGDTTSLKKSERLDFTLFPDDDVTQLEKGMIFSTIEEAYEMMENFVN